MRRGYVIFCWEPWLSCNFTSYQETVEVVYTQYLFEYVIPDLKSRHGLRKRKRRALSSTLEEKKLINKKYISDFSNNIDTTRGLFYIPAVQVGRSCSGGITGRGKVLGKSVKCGSPCTCHFLTSPCPCINIASLNGRRRRQRRWICTFQMVTNPSKNGIDISLLFLFFFFCLFSLFL